MFYDHVYIGGGMLDIERYLKNVQKKEKDIEDQQILDQMLDDLKKKHQQEYQQRLAAAKQTLELILKQGG